MVELLAYKKAPSLGLLAYSLQSYKYRSPMDIFGILVLLETCLQVLSTVYNALSTFLAQQLQLRSGASQPDSRNQAARRSPLGKWPYRLRLEQNCTEIFNFTFDLE